MKLELKHLAPYLPYGLKARISTPFDQETITEIVGLSENHAELIGVRQTVTEDFEFNDIKPILRPLKDLVKNINLENKSFVPIEVIQMFNYVSIDENGIVTDGDDEYGILFLPYLTIRQLLEWHFDVFELIDKGLAISIHDVGQVIA